MAPPVRKHRATYDDVLAAPDHMVAELVDGELLMSPRSAPPHAVCASVLGAEVNFRWHRPSGGDGDRPGGWWILDEPELHLGERLGRGDPRAIVLVPDVAGWRRERLPRMPEGVGFETPPDWVCEVLSPGTQRFDRIEKLRLYVEAGVGHVWLVDPLARIVEVYASLDRRPLRVLGYAADTENQGEPRFPPFEATPLDVGAWWPDQEGSSAAP